MMEKAGNIFGIIVARLLSIALVLMLTVAPVVLSTLSLVNAHVITDVVIDVFMDLVQQEKHAAGEYQLTNLSQVTARDISQDLLDQLPENLPSDVQDVLDQLPENNTGTEDDPGSERSTGTVATILEKYLGTPVTVAQVEKVMSSNTVKEILTVYTGDLTSVLTGEEKLSSLDAEKIKTIVNNNMDEVVQIVQELKPEMSKKETEVLKQEIAKTVEEKAEEILQILPKPEEIKEIIIETAPEVSIALKILEKKKTIEWGLIGAIAALSILIFLCRLENFRGFRWLAVDMFVGGGINALLSLILLIETPVIVGMIPDSALTSAISNILHAFDLALFERAAIILAAGGVMLTAYILIQKQRAKKTVVNVEE